ncbi:MAG: immunoglobulin-like domain-containing protein, partial [Opitutae bacterium]
CFHPAGWVAGPDLWQPADTQPHLNIGTAGGGRCQFWGDGVDLTLIPNRTGDIGQFQLGGWQTTREAASGLVSEVLIYDRVLSYGEIDALQYYLNNKYGLQDDAPVRGPVDTSSESDFEIRYAVVDSSGNRVTKTRTVQVILAPGSPVINMLGDPVVQHEAGIPYQDEGAALIDGDGNTLDPSLIEVVGTPSGNESGEYIISYNFQDSQGRPAVQRIRVVSVVDTTPPAITLLGDAVIKVEKDALVEDPGATASDLVDGEFTLPDPLKYTAGALDVVGFMNQSNDALMNIDGNQGLLATDPVGESIIYSGTLELFNDGQFRAVAPSINRNDQYQV